MCGVRWTLPLCWTHDGESTGGDQDSDATAMSLEARSDVNQKRGGQGSGLLLDLRRAVAMPCRALRPRHVRGGRDHGRIFGGRERFGKNEHEKMTRDDRSRELW